MNWTETSNYLKGNINTLTKLTGQHPIRIAGFDLDDTLIHKSKKSKKAKQAPWELLDKSIPKKIADLVSKKYLIIIFTNQGGMSLNKNFDKSGWKKSVDKLLDILMSKVKDQKYYVSIYVASKYDAYRKPNLGLWEQMKIDLYNDFDLDTRDLKLRISKKTFFVGDAAGRIEASFFKKKMYPSSSKGDFSDTDRKFALNIGLDFLTPEEFLINNPPTMDYVLSGLDPLTFINKVKETNYQFHPRKKEMIIMVGQPASGKSNFVKKYILPEGYVHVNQDTCKTKAKCLVLTKQALEKGKSVVIDNTNPDAVQRIVYTKLAQEYGYNHIRCIIMNTDLALSKHLNNVRHVYSDGSIQKISSIAYNIFYKKYVKPLKSENFDVIETVDFEFYPGQLDDPRWKKIFMKLSES